jgi:cephalosporin-C deacetylase-like acetyl esterase
MKIGLSTPRPDDFDAFWDSKLAAQARVPINLILTPVKTDVSGVEISLFVLDALGSKAHDYLAKPLKGGKLPALIQLQYAGVYALNAGADEQRCDRGVTPCALRVPAWRGHLLRWCSSTMCNDIACVAPPCICPRQARNAAPSNSRTGSLLLCH